MAWHCLECAIRTTGDDPKQDKVIELFEVRRESAISRDYIEAPQEKRPDRRVSDQNTFADSRVQRGSLITAGRQGGIRLYDLERAAKSAAIHGRVDWVASMSSQ